MGCVVVGGVEGRNRSERENGKKARDETSKEARDGTEGTVCRNGSDRGMLDRGGMENEATW